MSSRPGEIDQFVLALDHLEVARELLLSGSSAKERMAVILLDGLADAFIFRRLELLYDFTQEGWWYRARMPSYPQTLRIKAQREFHLRLKLARERTYLDEFYSGDGKHFVSDADATVLLIGHAYRNDAYHRDRHNPAVVGIIGRLMFAAVVRMFVRVQPHIHATVVRMRAQRIEQYGIEAKGMLGYREVAEQVGAQLAADLELVTADIVESLAADLEYRLTELDDGLSFLRESGRDIDEILEWGERWTVHGADDELLRLADLMDPMVRAHRAGLELSEIPDEFVTDADAAAKEWNKRWNTLWDPATRRVSLSVLNEIRNKPDELRKLTERPKLLTRYHEADRALLLIEDCVSDAVHAYDRAIQLQIDIARGK